ncbi:hypothetical protein [Cellulomonas aerilata]|uniref:Uncharacterized protein n=1 Tax=Cellulomonas aerilata TaxID=515326 RepID=A0A512DAS2_9CELL|nr:hypothetical protein [Cellulomonas aerilata]GEO33582.1 hypothetical protein CAE01nite_13070 [Cellulomonas aerilata]
MTSTQSESTGDDRNPSGEVPNPETGAGIGAGEPSTFEPEEDPEAVTDPESGVDAE